MVEANPAAGGPKMIDTTNGNQQNFAKQTVKDEVQPGQSRSFQINKRVPSQYSQRANASGILSSKAELAGSIQSPSEPQSDQRNQNLESQRSAEQSILEKVLQPPPRATKEDLEEPKEFVKPPFNSSVLDHGDLYKEKPLVYKFETDPEKLEIKCELCLDLPCCPEHCCNWDACACGDCDECKPDKPRGPQRPGSSYRKVFNNKTWKEDLMETDEPELLIRSDLNKVEAEQVRPKKKLVISKREAEIQKQQKDEKDEKEYHEQAPRELIRTEEGTLIQNFEVDFGPQEELDMAGGIRGIRALRQQRHAIEDQIAVKSDLDQGRDRFQQYGGQISQKEAEGAQEESKGP